jgi:hypothetical protein
MYSAATSHGRNTTANAGKGAHRGFRRTSTKVATVRAAQRPIPETTSFQTGKTQL